MNKLIYKILENYKLENSRWKNIVVEVQKNLNRDYEKLIEEYYSCICIYESLKYYHPEEKEKQLYEELKLKTKVSLLKLEE
jgi:hypothetical protein